MNFFSAHETISFIGPIWPQLNRRDVVFVVSDVIVIVVKFPLPRQLLLQHRVDQELDAVLDHHVVLGSEKRVLASRYYTQADKKAVDSACV